MTLVAGVCTPCYKFRDPNHYLKNDNLPVWYKDDDKNNMPNYHVPDELNSLSQAERMLVQLVSPFVPLHHIKNGTCGLSGHVCAYEQDVSEFVQRLPRRAEDTALLRVVKTIRTEIGGDKESTYKAFRVSKRKVLDALLWLKQHNRFYKDIVIDMSNMDWMEGDTDTLHKKDIEVEDELHTRRDDNSTNADIGPCPGQAFGPEENSDNIQSYGYIDQGGPATLSENDAKVNSSLQAAVAKSPYLNTFTTLNVPLNLFYECYEVDLI
jgi:hypothetical protein